MGKDPRYGAGEPMASWEGKECGIMGSLLSGAAGSVLFLKVELAISCEIQKVFSLLERRRYFETALFGQVFRLEFGYAA